MTHPHKEIIIALLDDPTLEVERKLPGQDGDWVPSSIFQAIDNVGNAKFRLREKPKPDVVRYATIRKQDGGLDRHEDDNLRLTFSHDGTLKNAEVI